MHIHLRWMTLKAGLIRNIEENMRKILILGTIITVLFSGIAPQAQNTGKQIVLLPFYDESGYRGPWKLRYEVPIMLGDMLVDEYFNIVEMDSVLSVMGPPPKKGIFGKFFGLFTNTKDKQKVLTDNEILSISRQVGADYAIIGTVKEFKYNRQGGGEPMIGGYKSYTANVKVEQVRVIQVSNGTVLATVTGEDKKNSRGLGLELFGKPRRLDLEFYSLDSLDFGSKRYLNTLLGQATIEALNNAQKEIRSAITQPDNEWFKEKKFIIMSVETGAVSINAGSGDGIKAGDIFRVYATESEALVGKIRVTSVWSDHISRAEIMDGQDEIRPNDYILPDR
ncbi:MAG: hypothetical protein JXB48_06070 [Candidatus Latescibacteria bacterium]|nr:hypothetical protein [Candidatus Latescibacterota bacterium]